MTERFGCCKCKDRFQAVFTFPIVVQRVLLIGPSRQVKVNVLCVSVGKYFISVIRFKSKMLTANRLQNIALKILLPHHVSDFILRHLKKCL